MKKNPITIASLQILIVVACLSISFCATANATGYYVSIATGNDSNPGTSALPFKTIQKCANVAKAGDTCNIHAGTYREQVNLVNSGSASTPITFTGVSGETATIDGADLITGWTQYSGNIYVANASFTTPPTQLYVDGQFYDIAHYPNSGYLTATSNSADSISIVDSNLTLSTNQIVGATVVTKSVPWALSSNLATAYNNTAHKITLNSNISVMQSQYGFYLQNMLWMLDSPGEWFYDPTAGKLYLWTGNNDNPNNHTVEVSSRSYGISGWNRNYTTIQNLTIANANQYDVYIGNSNNVLLNNLSISGGQMGIQSYNMTNYTVQNNSVQNTLSDGIYFNGSTNTSVNISNNTINNAGNVGSPKQSVGSLVINASSSTDITINNNTITNSGYSGIWYTGNIITVENNIIDKSCLVLDDCGGIYTNTDGTPGMTSTISGNTITNSIGNFNGTPNTNTHAQGIYLDDLSNGYTVSNNTISNADFGIYIHTGYNNNVTSNKVYQARIYGFLLSEDNSGGLTGEVAGAVHNNIVTGNTFESIANSTVNYWLGSGTADYYSEFGSSTVNFGTFNNNQYCHPNIGYAVGTLNINTGTNYTLSNWQKATGQDLNSTDTNSSCEPQVILTLTKSGAGLGTITSNPVGVNCSSATCTASFNAGSNITLTAVAGSGSVFSGWSGACSGIGTCSVTMNVAQSVTAHFNAQYNLTVSTTGGGFGAVFGNGINCGTEETICSQSLAGGTVANLTATPANDSVFSGWSGACSGIGNCTVMMNANMTVTANFSFGTNTVTASAGTGGTISPAGTLNINYGANQTFTVIPTAGYMAQLTVDGSPVVLTNNTYTLSNVTTAHTIVASFSLQPEILTTSAGIGGTITPSGSVSVNYGASQTFTVTANPDYTAHLTVDGMVVPLINNTFTLSNTTAAHTIMASFSLQTKTITASAGTGGTITPSGAVSVNYGANQNFTVIPNAGYTAQLTVDGTLVALTNNAYTLTDVTAAHVIAASFTLIPPVTYTLGVNTANGSVTQTVNGIVSNGPYNAGTVVTLTAAPASGYQFNSWSGAVTGTTNPMVVTMNANENVTANFILIPSVTTIFGNTAPLYTSWNDPSAVELGVQFQSSSSGTITGIRFYKGSGNTGTHVAHLWSSSGALLASATFIGETASGWQQVNFSQPVTIVANTTYVASYFAPNGHYALNQLYFTVAKTNGPLTALANGNAKNGNGVFSYGEGVFPTKSYLNSNYWVDVVFQP